MMSRFTVSLAGLLVCAALPASVAAQPLGTFRWQLQPFCNIVSVAVTQNGAVYRLEGTDDQCGNGTDAASVTGTAFLNPDGTIGLGLNIVTAPGGRPLHVDAEVTTAAFSGTWRDSAGATGAFTFTPGAGSGGSPRPLPASPIPAAIVLNPDGGFVAGGALGAGAIPASGPGLRAMWYAGKAAFRAGESLGAEWDDANVGMFSVAFGSHTLASGLSSTALGTATTATGSQSTAMGNFTTASGQQSTAMGHSTTASGGQSTATGYSTTAEGFASLAMGHGSFAGGDASVALGTYAVTTASADGSFAFADRSSFDVFGALGPNEFNVRAAGGVSFYTNAAANAGVRLAGGGNQWLVISDINMKENFRDLDGDAVLSKVARMPIREWNYKTQDAAIRHVGPTAQDFHSAFGLGEDPLRIGTIDADGIALRAIQALEARTRAADAANEAVVRNNEALKARLATLARHLAALSQRLARLEAQQR